MEMIEDALRKELGEGKKAGILGGIAIGPGLGAAFLAKAACPLCYPAIGSVLSAVGLGFLFEGPYFIILAGLFLAVAIFGLAYRAKSRHGYGPLGLGLAGIALLILGRVVLSLDWLMYLGVVILLGASVWNLIPWRSSKSCSSTICDTPGTDAKT